MKCYDIRDTKDKIFVEIFIPQSEIKLKVDNGSLMLSFQDNKMVRNVKVIEVISKKGISVKEQANDIKLTIEGSSSGNTYSYALIVEKDGLFNMVLRNDTKLFQIYRKHYLMDENVPKFGNELVITRVQNLSVKNIDDLLFPYIKSKSIYNEPCLYIRDFK
jgi:hypothetical protein